ncbi:DUF6087 family protein [Streptomyces griseofuscus]|uniref:DUF6087 family protein n=1 Tax=Streptomyces griseofuscus TaxID=146922 RepID=UPI003795D88B
MAPAGRLPQPPQDLPARGDGRDRRPGLLTSRASPARGPVGRTPGRQGPVRTPRARTGRHRNRARVQGSNTANSPCTGRGSPSAPTPRRHCRGAAGQPRCDRRGVPGRLSARHTGRDRRGRDRWTTPLEEWAERRGLRPARGEWRATPLGDRPEHGAHVDPDAPRGIQEWDGHRWTPAGAAEDQAAAAAATGRDANARAERVPLPAFGKLPPMPEPWRPARRFYRPGTPRQ